MERKKKVSPKVIKGKGEKPKAIPKKKGGQPGNKGGRPVKYDTKFNKIVYKLALLGAKNKQIADSLSITEVTFYEWRNTKPQFSNALKKGREDADAAVAESTFRNAIGYSLIETDVRVVNGELVQTKIKKNYPPNPTSAIFWLKNKQPDIWKDKQEVLNSGEIGVKVEEVSPKLDSLSDEEKLTWLALQKKLRK